eukprot:TRINITY_DN12400_c0_g1_i1.p1 TRINITY_DN12400_c0_g1~~TRINITY_DN12400_c0_g1_i1.p1  ORF type:complete len:895 (-),score=325.55 TRINITY_DN12400_c0_g1_i1:1247-3931(-)
MSAPALTMEDRLRQAEQREVNLARRVAQFNDMVQELRGRNDALQEELLEAKQASSLAASRNVSLVETLTSDVTQLKQQLQKSQQDSDLLRTQLRNETDKLLQENESLVEQLRTQAVVSETLMDERIAQERLTFQAIDQHKAALNLILETISNVDDIAADDEDTSAFVDSSFPPQAGSDTASADDADAVPDSAAVDFDAEATSDEDLDVMQAAVVVVQALRSERRDHRRLEEQLRTDLAERGDEGSALQKRLHELEAALKREQDAVKRLSEVEREQTQTIAVLIGTETALRQSLEALTAEHNEQQQLLHDADSEITMLVTNRDELTSQLAQTQRDLLQQTQLNTQLRAELTDLEQTRDEQVQQLLEHERSEETLRGHLDETLLELMNLKQSASTSASSACAQIAALQSERTKLQERVADLEAIVADLRSLVAEVQQQMATYIEKSNQTQEQYQTEVQTLQREKEQLSKQVSQLSALSTSVQAELQSVSTTLSGDAEQLRATLSATEAQLAESQQHVTQLEKQLQSIKRDRLAALSEGGAARQRIDALDEQVREQQSQISARDSQLVSTQQQLDEAQQQLQAEREQLALLNEKLSLVRSHLEEKQQALSETLSQLDHATEQVTNTNDARTAVDAQLLAAKERIVALENAAVTARLATEKRERELNKQLAQAEQLAEQLGSQAAATQTASAGELSSLNQQLQMYQAESQQLLADNEDLQEKVNTLTRERARTHHVLQTALLQQEEFKKQYSEYAEAMVRLQEKIDAQQQQLKEQQQNSGQLTQELAADLSDIRGQIPALQRYASGALLDSEELQQQLQGKAGEAVMLRQLNREMKQRINDLEDEVSQLRGDLRVSNARIAVTDTPARQLHKQTTELMSQFVTRFTKANAGLPPSKQP